MPSLQRFCERMRYWCDDADLGYDQVQRWNVWVGGETDCSALVITALREAGFDTGGATYTGDLSWNLTSRGWQRLSPTISTARPGDILLSDQHHVAAVVSGWGWWSTVAEAWLDEKGGIYYGQSGDQTGLETRTRGIYDFPWDCILRYAGESEEEVSAEELWGYKNSSMNGNNDAYQLLTDIHKQTTRIDNAGWATPEGHDFFGRINSLQKNQSAMQADIAKIKKAVTGMQAGGAEVDVDAIADAVADKLAARMRD